MKVFVTGVEGYIGALLAPMLIERGHEVVGLDTGYYRDGWLYSDKGLTTFPRMINKDLRLIGEDDLRGCDAVVHLAELSNDPLGQNNPENTFKINHQGSVALAKKAKAVGIARFVYTSSCSVYGVGSDDFRTEEAGTNPQTAYAHCKVRVETDVGALADDGFSPVFLRNATAYGASPRMRFDIVLNNLAGFARTIGKIAMTSDGTPWRPLVHVLDICQAIVCAVEAPRESIHNQIFNVGHNADNYRVREIAEIVGETFTGCELTFGPSGGDNRSYRVSFDKIHGRLPGFRCAWDARKGAQQLHEIYDRIAMGKETFEFRAFTRLKQLEYLIKTRQIDNEFFWRA
ncbi:MAG TPA: SDR family oxidoreductase [Acidiferrobacterales bacterium]